MMRVRICTSRCRCQSSCRRSRFSSSATQIRGKRSSIRSRSSSSASWRSVFCLRTRLVRISAASPIHSSNCTSVRTAQTSAHAHWLPSQPALFSAHLELAVELLRFLAVPQFPLVPFTTVRIDKRNLSDARVIVTTYNDHVRLLSPEPWLVSATKVYSGMGADIVMESLHSRPGSECKRLFTTVALRDQNEVRETTVHAGTVVVYVYVAGLRWWYRSGQLPV